MTVLLCVVTMMYVFMYMYRVFIMDSKSYTSARNNLAKTMERVCNDHAPVAITRKGEGHGEERYSTCEESPYCIRFICNPFYAPVSFLS